MNNTEQAILELTSAINSLANTIDGIVFAGVSMVVLLILMSWLMTKHYDKRTGEMGFHFNEGKAEKLYNSNHIELLITYCEKWQKKYPNNVSISWYLGLAHFHKGDYVLAKSFFNDTARINPTWKSAVAAYLEQIENHADTTDKASH